jgi:hypothetical protein
VETLKFSKPWIFCCAGFDDDFCSFVWLILGSHHLVFGLGSLGNLSVLVFVRYSREREWLCVTAQPNMSYIIRFGPYHPHGFVFGDASPLLNLTPQNTYNMLVTSTTNKASYQTLTRAMWDIIIHPLEEVRQHSRRNRTAIEVDSDTKYNNLTQHVVYYSLWALSPSRVCSWWCEPTFEFDDSKRVQHVASNTTNMANYQTLTHWCEILQSTPLTSPTTPSAQSDCQWGRLWYQM